jgi:hypothetical protein
MHGDHGTTNPQFRQRGDSHAFLYNFYASPERSYPILTFLALFCPEDDQGGVLMGPLEPWMLLVGLLCIVYAVMVVLWFSACKKAPKATFWPLVADHRGQSAAPLASDSFLDKWLRRLTTM